MVVRAKPLLRGGLVSLFGRGGPIPAPSVLDGIAPVFLEVGADPRVSPGIELPIGSRVRMQESHFYKWGPDALDWQIHYYDSVSAIGGEVALNVTGLQGDLDQKIGFRFRGKLRDIGNPGATFGIRWNSSDDSKVGVQGIETYSNYWMAHQNQEAGISVPALYIPENSETWENCIEGWFSLKSGTARYGEVSAMNRDNSWGFRRALGFHWSNTSTEITWFGISVGNGELAAGATLEVWVPWAGK